MPARSRKRTLTRRSSTKRRSYRSRRTTKSAMVRSMGSVSASRSVAGLALYRGGAMPAIATAVLRVAFPLAFTTDGSSPSIGSFALCANDNLNAIIANIGGNTPSSSQQAPPPWNSENWFRMYERYMVRSSKLRLRMVNATAGGAPKTMITNCYVSDDGGINTTNNVLANPTNTTQFFMSNDASPSINVNSFYGKTWFGWKDAKDVFQDYAASTGSNQSSNHPVFYQVSTYAVDNSTSVDCGFFVEMEFVVDFRDPVTTTYSV